MRCKVLKKGWRAPPVLERLPKQAGARALSRRGFTITESLAALAILMVIVGVLTELGMGSLLEQRRNATRQQALETAANILEAAQACEWAALTPDWGKAQRLPEALAERLEEGQLLVQVEPEPSRPQTRRITVEIDWSQGGKPARPVKLVALRSARSASPQGGKP